MFQKGLIVFALLILNCNSAYAKIKICKIKFNEKNGLFALENKINKKLDDKNTIKENFFKCYKIGVEHDKNKIPIESSPIYACCKNE